MNVETASSRNVEHCLRQNQAVSSNDHDVGLQRFELGHSIGVAQGRRLQHRDVLLERVVLDRARRQFLAAAGRTIGLRQHGARLVRGGDQRLKRRYGKVRCSGENDFWGCHFRAAVGALLVSATVAVQAPLLQSNRIGAAVTLLLDQLLANTGTFRL